LILESLGYAEYAIIIIAAIGSAVIKNAVGVGAGIFMLPCLSLVLPAKLALGLGAPIMLVSDISGVINYWGDWDKKELYLLLPPALLGVILGALMIKAIPNELFRLWIGFFAILFSSYQLMKLSSLRMEITTKWLVDVFRFRKAFAILFGFMSGVASSVIHAGGLVMSLYLIGRSKSSRAFVGTFVLFFVLMNFLKVIVYWQIEILSWELLLLTLIISPLMIFGGFWGSYLNKRVSQKAFTVAVLSVIWLIGVKMLL